MKFLTSISELQRSQGVTLADGTENVKKREPNTRFGDLTPSNNFDPTAQTAATTSQESGARIGIPWAPPHRNRGRLRPNRLGKTPSPPPLPPPRRSLFHLHLHLLRTRPRSSRGEKKPKRKKKNLATHLGPAPPPPRARIPRRLAATAPPPPWASPRSPARSPAAPRPPPPARARQVSALSLLSSLNLPPPRLGGGLIVWMAFF